MLNIQNFPPFFALHLYNRTSLKRIQGSSVYKTNYAVIKHSKHGIIVLTLQSSLFWIDRTIYMDINSNPGRERIENFQGSRPPPSDSSSRNLNNRAVSFLSNI